MDSLAQDGSDLWVCPRCRGPLRREGEALDCTACGGQYPLVAGIPDFRVSPGARRKIEQERGRVRRWQEWSEELTPEELVERLFASRPGWSPDAVRKRVTVVLEGRERLSRELRGWLRPCLPVDGTGPVLDLGCGAGQLLVALARAGHRPVGLDLSLELLVVAGALLRSEGVRPILAAGEAERLPLPDHRLPSVVSLDVIEHVDEPTPYLEEIGRVLRPDGALALTTPNRFSLAAEPHVSVWGVGWLPRRCQRRYAEWRSELSYENVRLLSLPELRRLVRRASGLEPEVLVPEIPEEEIGRFPPRRKALGRLYNRLVAAPAGRGLIRPVAPFYRVRAFGADRRGGRPSRREGPAQ